MLVLKMRRDGNSVQVLVDGNMPYKHQKLVATIKIIGIDQGSVLVGFDGSHDVTFLRSDAKNKEPRKPLIGPVTAEQQQELDDEARKPNSCRCGP